MMNVSSLACLTAIAISLTMNPSLAQNKPDIFVLGDSQISFGAGESYLRFFNELPKHCKMNGAQKKAFAKLGRSRTAAIGVRSTSLQSWTAKSGAPKNAICEVDKKYGVNAGVYGIGGNNSRKFVQIGKGADYQFCKPNTPAFEAAFKKGYYKPKLLVLAFLGNSADRWANDRAATAQDVRRTISQIPADIPCIFMTTAPVYSKKTNDMRMKAQDAVADAFAQAGGHCKVVKGLTRQTRAAIEGQKKYFKLRKSGQIADPLHPKPAATRLFLDLNMPALCDAVFASLK
ncbi:MAG: SGNH/GDSL hydrolase family protein [Litoreibacter sp.]